MPNPDNKDPLAPKQDNSWLDAIPVKETPWSKSTMDSNAKGVPEVPEATPRPWLREIHDARGDEARIVIVSRNPKFTSGYYVICADGMRMRRDQTIIDYGLICEAVNSYDALQAQNKLLREALEGMLDLWVRAQPVLGKGRRSVEYDSQVIDARRALRGEK